MIYEIFIILRKWKVHQECNINNILTDIIKNRSVEIRSMEKLYKIYENYIYSLLDYDF